MKSMEFEHIGIVTKDMERSASFYRDFLGYEAGPVKEIPEMHMKIRCLQKGASCIELLEPEKTSGVPSSTFGIKHLAFRCENIEEAHAEVKKKGFSLLHQVPVRHGNLSFFFCTGPDGEFIEFMQKEDA